MLSAVKPWKSWKVHHISYTSCCQLYNHGRAGKCIIYHTRHAVRCNTTRAGKCFIYHTRHAVSCNTTEELESTSFIIHVMLSAVTPRKSWWHGPTPVLGYPSSRWVCWHNQRFPTRHYSTPWVVSFCAQIFIFTRGAFQPDCSADRPLTGPRQSTIYHKLWHKRNKGGVVLQEEFNNHLGTDILSQIRPSVLKDAVCI